MSLPELMRTSSRARAPAAAPPREMRIFTVVAGGERLGLPVECVHTIVRIARITPVPCGPREVIGLANLRGKIVTVVSLRLRLGMPDIGDIGPALAIGIEHLGESIALVVDEVGDVISVSEADRILAPPHLSGSRLGVTGAVLRFDEGILSVLELDRLFEFDGTARPKSTPRIAAAPGGRL